MGSLHEHVHGVVTSRDRRILLAIAADGRLRQNADGKVLIDRGSGPAWRKSAPSRADKAVRKLVAEGLLYLAEDSTFRPTTPDGA